MDNLLTTLLKNRPRVVRWGRFDPDNLIIDRIARMRHGKLYDYCPIAARELTRDEVFQCEHDVLTLVALNDAG
jgi:hypothetical protein